MYDVLNIVSLILSFILFGYLYTLSVQPVKRVEKRGEKAWKECSRLRIFSSIFMFTATANIFLWLVIPVESMNWKVSENITSIIIGIVILVLGGIVMGAGAIAAGKESLQPSEETKMYGGIYKYIRHPQALGEFPMFVAFAFFVNSWLMVMITTLFVLIYTPIMVHYEEIDLVKRFGDPYKEYQKRTWALFPKLF